MRTKTLTNKKGETYALLQKCTMPDTARYYFDAEGVCSACHYRRTANVDWDAHFKEFEGILHSKYRGMNGPGGYDCAVAVSAARTATSRSGC